MADYSDLMKLERKPKQLTSPVHTPLSEKQTTQKDDASKPTDLQADKQVNQQTSLHANLQASKPASVQIQPSIEKLSTYMRGDYKKRLKQLALDKDCDAYEVLQEAVELYFQSLDSKK